ncbi:nitrite extrusion protein 2, partial [Salmonella enterica subsp. arizonae]|nr:nitrite extrusion protein 2 [Salmonella enterica subsp. arizonae]
MVIGFDLAINQIAQLGLSSFPVFYYLERLFSKRILVKAKDG